MFEKYDIDYGYYNKMVKDADDTAAIIERFYLMPDHPDWPRMPSNEMTYCCPEYQDPHRAAALFLKAFGFAIRKRDALRDEGA